MPAEIDFEQKGMELGESLALTFADAGFHPDDIRQAAIAFIDTLARLHKQRNG